MPPPLLLLTLAACLSLGGCYYGHLARGQVSLLWNRQPIPEVVEDPATTPEIRDLLAQVDEVRAFARTLGLEVDDQYTSYVDWPDDRVVTTLVRTRRGSLEAVPWWYPFLGSLPYQGYFDRARAEAEAERLSREEGFEVCVSGVAAYSTLGWLDDPVTRPMLVRGPAMLVETLFHELVHATAFVPDEADFNEGVAQFIGQQAAIRLFERHPPGPGTPLGWPGADRVRASIDDRARIAHEILALRDALAPLEGRPDRAERRAAAVARTRARLAALPLRVLDPERVVRRVRLSDPCLALRGTYVRDAPRHAAVLAALGGDLPAMIDRLRRWEDEDLPVEAFFDVEALSAEEDAETRGEREERETRD